MAKIPRSIKKALVADRFKYRDDLSGPTPNGSMLIFQSEKSKGGVLTVRQITTKPDKPYKFIEERVDSYEINPDHFILPTPVDNDDEPRLTPRERMLNKLRRLKKHTR